MPYKDSEKQREANLRSQHKRRGVTPDALSHPAVTPSGWETILAKVKQHDQGMTVSFTPSELKTILQWGIDQGKIRPRDIVARTYGLTQKYGVARLDKHELWMLLNGELARKKIDSPLYFLGTPIQRGSLADGYMYSNEM